MVAGNAEALLASFKAAFEAEPCNLEKCSEYLAQLKLIVFSGLPSLVGPSESSVGGELAQSTLELACFLSIRQEDLQGFERHVSQLKMYYNDDKAQKPSEQKHPILGLFLLHLLASDRIGDFHTELELIPLEQHENVYIKRPIELERSIMEGNYAKVLEAHKDFPKTYYPLFMERLMETVRLKVGASLERSYEHLPVKTAAQMLILSDVAALQEFAMKENERKAQEEANGPGADMTPSLARRAPQGLVRWEVKGDKLYFKRSEERRLAIPALDIMVNTIGYATDLERIV